MSTAPAHPMRAAGFMLASTVSFGLMAIVIRLASQTLHTFEIACANGKWLIDQNPASIEQMPIAQRTK